MGNAEATAAATGGAKTSADVRAVDLSGRGLRAVPEELLRVRTTLESLSLSGNCGGGDEEEKKKMDLRLVAEFQRLRRLDLSRNALASVDAEVFLLRDLEVLELQFNALKELPVLVSNLLFLRELNVAHNALTALDPLLARCISLTSLNVAHNALTTLPPELCTMSGLARLVANNNRITELPPQIGAMAGLTLLDLSENSLTALPEGIGRLGRLTKLYLDNNDLAEVGPQLGALVSLRELNLRSNRLTALPSELARLTALTVCDLADNPWDSPKYTAAADVDELRAFLQTLSSSSSSEATAAARSRKILSKAERRTMSLSQARAKQPATASDFVFGEQRKRLLQIKGISKQVLALPVEVSHRSLNAGDAFVLDAGSTLYVWLGAKSNRAERAKAAHLARLLSAEAAGGPRIVTVDCASKHPKDSEFWADLGDKGPVAPEAGQDARAMDAMLLFKLFKIQESEDGRMRVLVVTDTLSKTMLTSDACFVLDDGSDVWVWVGTYSSPNEKSWAFLKAEELSKWPRRNPNSEIRWALEGAEPVLFVEHFADWVDNTWSLDDKEKARIRQAKEQEEALRKKEEAEYLRVLAEREKELAAQKAKIKAKPPPEVSLTPSSASSSSTSTSPQPPSRKPPSTPTEIEDAPPPARKPPSPNPDSGSEEEEEERTVSVKPTVVEVPKPQGASKTCPSCSATFGAHAKFCTKCGTKLPAIAETPAPAPETQTSPIPQDAQPPVHKPEPETRTTAPQIVQPVAAQAGSSSDLSEVVASVEAEMAAEGKVRRRRKPTRNPVRERKEKEAAAVANAAPRQPEASRAAQVLGGYGILYSVRADEFLFAQRREAREDISRALENTSIVPKDLPRLIQVKGRRRPFAKQVERSWRSLNSGDCFVADEGKFGKHIWQWNGRDSNRMERGKAMDIAKNLRDKERFNSKLMVVEEGREPPEFWAAIGGSPGGALADKTQGGDDEEAERSYGKYVVLYRVVPPSGGEDSAVDLERAVPEGRSLVKAHLQPGMCYILDCVSEVYTWTAMHVAPKYRQGAIKKALSIVSDRERQCWVAPMFHEWAGSEQVMFRERFSDWNSVPIAVQAPVAPSHQRSGSKALETKANVARMFAPKPEKEEIMVDDGSGRVSVFLVEEFKRVQIPPEAAGEFYSGDSYVVLYEYIWKNKDCHLLYYWQGRTSSVIGKGTSAALTIELDDRLKKTAAMSKEVRVVQGKEPKHFLLVFKGKLVIHHGRDPHGSSAQTGQKADSARLFHVRGSDASYTRAIQTRLSALSLNSSNVFLLVVPGSQRSFIWHGRFCNTFEKDFAAAITSCTSLKRADFKTVSEGEEPAQFWELLGGKEKFPSQEHTARCDPRLFQCSVATGSFEVDEVPNFSQDDLVRDDVMMVDARFSVFVWIGRKSHPAEQRFSFETALEYAAHAERTDSSRPRNGAVLRVLEGEEPASFTSLFHGWETNRVLQYDAGLLPVSAALKEYTRRYSYEELVNKRFPQGIDESALETYLEDAEFQSLFKMTREAFAKLPLWQRQNMKRDLKLW